MYLFVYPRLSNTHVVYGKRGYGEVVERAVEESMQGAVEESKAQPDYDTVGEACTYMCMNIDHSTCIYMYIYLVGDYRCTPRLNCKCISYNSALPRRKVQVIVIALLHTVSVIHSLTWSTCSNHKIVGISTL